MQLSILGPLRAGRAGDELDLGTPQQRAMLAVLLVRAGESVTMHEIIDALWPQEAPPSGVNVVQRYVSRLRRVLPVGTLLRWPGGYRLAVAAGHIDLLMFRQLVTEADTAERDDPRRALQLLVEALELWRGPVAAGIDESVRTAPAFVHIEGERSMVAARAANLALRTGGAQQVLPALRGAAAAAPLDEVLQAAVMRALTAAGRQAEALSVFAGTRQRLADELGVDPGADLAAAHAQVLRAEITQHPAPATSVPAEIQPVVRPAHLPADLPAFVGREPLLDELSQFLIGSERDVGAVRIAAVSGMGGVGKSTLAVRCAHRLTGDFPDGQLYVDMRGFDASGEPVDPHDALGGLLGALGVRDRHLPLALADRVALYRSIVAGRRMIILIDNARNSEHARPLLPGMPGSVAIVTSRDPLTGLVVRDGARPLVLDLLSRAQAQALLEQRLGPERTTGDPAAVAHVIEACGGLPLALAMFAARAATHPQFALRLLATEVDTSRHRLDSFRVETDPDLRAVFSWSYRLLGVAAATLFRLLALYPGPTFGAAAAASLLGAPAGLAAELLRELTRMSLLTEQSPGRFRCHDLVRAYSIELMHAHESPRQQADAERRLLDYYLHSTRAAADKLDHLRRPVGTPPACPVDVTPDRFATFDDAMSWLTGQRSALVTMVERAAEARNDGHVRHLASALGTFLRRREFWSDWEATQRHALDAAHRTGDGAAQARVHYDLAFIYSESALDQPADSEHHAGEAIRLSSACDDARIHAHALLILAELRQRQGRRAEQRRLLDHAVELYLTVQGRDPHAVLPDFVGYAHQQLGDPSQALPHLVQALDRLRGAGNHREATAWHTLANLHADRGDWDEALRANERSAEVYRSIGDEHMEGVVLAAIGQRCAVGGPQRRARWVLRQASEIFERLGDPRAVTIRSTLDKLGAGSALADRPAASRISVRRPDRNGAPSATKA